MKKQILSILAILFLATVGVFAQSVAGVYDREIDFMGNPTVLILKEDGNFEISTGSTSVRGTYKIVGSKILFTDKQGDYADTMAGEGSYAMLMGNNILILKTLSDKAHQRENVISASKWRKIK